MKNICRNKNKEGFDYEEKVLSMMLAGAMTVSMLAGCGAGSDEAATQTTRQPTQRQRQLEQQKQAGVLQKHPEIR